MPMYCFECERKNARVEMNKSHKTLPDGRVVWVCPNDPAHRRFGKKEE